MITIVCGGSRGDVQPYLILAKALQDRGLACRVVSSPGFEALADEFGVSYAAIGPSAEELGVDPRLLDKARQADSPLKMLLTFKAMAAYGDRVVAAYDEACEGSDAVIYHPGMAVAYFAAERLGVPAILASPFPLHATGERPSLLAYGRRSAMPVGLSHRALQGMLWMAASSALRPYLRRRYGRLPKGFGIPYERGIGPRHPALVNCSPSVFPRPADWPEEVHQLGYWTVDAEGYRPPDELAEFLAAGDKPVYLGFGSMLRPEEAAAFAPTAVATLKRLGLRGLLGGVPRGTPLPEGFLAADGVPHSWLFPRTAAVCHHAGAGTAAAQFLAGVPGVAVPFALDQHAWAARAYELGVSPEPLPRKRLTESLLARAVAAALGGGRPEAAAALGKRLAGERGAAACAAVVASAVGGSR